MKKNKMMRVASALLVAVLMTTSVISGTFAKYVTTDSATDSARVAKWGVVLQVVGNLYGDTYKDVIVKEDDTTLTVQSVDKTDDIVAPGTKNDEGFTISLKGQPEVAGKVTTTMKIQNIFLAAGTYGVMVPVATGVITEANFTEFEGLYTKTDGKYTLATAWSDTTTFYTLEDEVTVDETGYYPVVYALAGNTESSGNTEADSLKVAADAIATQLGLTAGTAADDTSVTYTGTKTFTANTDLATLKCDGLTLTWAWAIGTEDDSTTTGVNEAVTAVNNGADTILGLLENVDVANGEVVKITTTTDNSSGTDVTTTTIKAPTEYTDYCLDTMFDIEITVEQVD